MGFMALYGLRSKKWVDSTNQLWVDAQSAELLIRVIPLRLARYEFWSTCIAKIKFVGRNNLTQVCISWDVLNFILFWSFIWCRIWFPFSGDAKKMSKVSIYLWNHGLHCGSFITSLLACIDFNKNDCMHGLRWFVRACLGQFINKTVHLCCSAFIPSCGSSCLWVKECWALILNMCQKIPFCVQYAVRISFSSSHLLKILWKFLKIHFENKWCEFDSFIARVKWTPYKSQLKEEDMNTFENAEDKGKRLQREWIHLKLKVKITIGAFVAIFKCHDS